MTAEAGTARPPAPRVDGYAPIDAYAALGDGRTVALVAADGAIDWMPLPSIDGHPVFAAILDAEHGGSIHLSPPPPFTVERTYVEGTNVLATTYRTGTGAIRVTDALNVGRSGRLPWTELARRVEGLDGEVEVRWRIELGTSLGLPRPWVRDGDGMPLVSAADQQLAVRTEGLGSSEVSDVAVFGAATITAGDRALLAVVATDHEPLLPAPCTAVDDRIEHTVHDWQRWCRGVHYDGPWRDAVLRSALALKLLIYEPSGAIAGAATTSLPEAIGGDRNWDYRYTWIRDTSFALDALAELGLAEELHDALSALLASVAATAPDPWVFYRLDGGVVRKDEEHLPAPGYRGSKPVRAGNGAADQEQLGVFGDLFDAVIRYTDRGGVIDPATASLLQTLADRTCDRWDRRDSGIWELGDRQHYTISKIGCWVALDRALQLVEAGQLSSLRAGRWEHERARIHEWVDQRCWSDAKGSYTFHADTDELDASVLLAARTHFCASDDPRLASTVDAIVDELADGPYLYRYGSMRGREGCFLACSFWLVQALCHLGRLDDAAALMDQLVAATNDVGLLAEEIDPVSGHQLGNTPQALSHLSLITAAVEFVRRRSASQHQGDR